METNCIKCSVVLTEETRYRTKTKISNQCIDCRRAYAREYAKKNRKDTCTSDICIKCSKSFELVERWKNNQCIECYREYQRQYQAKRRSNPKHVNLIVDRAQTCFKCEIPFDDTNRYGTTNQCKQCYRQMTHNWYTQNKSKIRREFNERYQLDERFREYRNYKAAISRIITGKQKTSKYINFTPDDLNAWLQYVCNEISMSFEDVQNGLVVVDHVIPLNQGLKELIPWEYVIGWWNMIPLDSTENLTKNKYINFNQLTKHHTYLCQYLQSNNIQDPLIEVYLTYLQDTSQCRETRKASNTTHPLETLDDTQGNDLGHGNSVEDDELTASLGAMSI